MFHRQLKTVVKIVTKCDFIIGTRTVETCSCAILSIGTNIRVSLVLLNSPLKNIHVLLALFHFEPSFDGPLVQKRGFFVEIHQRVKLVDFGRNDSIQRLDRVFFVKNKNNDDSDASFIGKQGRIHGNPVVDGWAGAVMRKLLGIQKCDGWTYRPTDLPTDTARCRVACPRLKS